MIDDADDDDEDDGGDADDGGGGRQEAFFFWIVLSGFVWFVHEKQRRNLNCITAQKRKCNLKKTTK
jgi:hypothetical protein